MNESARLAGDNYSTQNILMTEAVATLIAGVCGGVSQSTPYIGHPAYKAMGARAGYTLATGLFVGLGGILGYIPFMAMILPISCLAPILIFVSFDIVAQAYHETPRNHLAYLIDKRIGASAVVFGIASALSLFGVIHSVLPTGGLYLPWSATLAGSNLPYHWAAGYACWAAILLILGPRFPQAA